MNKENFIIQDRNVEVVKFKPFILFLNLQFDIFELVGSPLVENCLAGFNSSIFAYGQVFYHTVCYIYLF